MKYVGKDGLIINGSEVWHKGNFDPASKVDKAEFNAHDSDTTKHIASGERTTWNTVTNKVDKVTGKQLSTEDYTTEEKNKLSGIEDNANNYIHPTTSGNKHIPSGGASGQFLKWDSDGTATWDSIPGGLELGETSGTAYRGDRGKIAYDHSQSAHAPSDAQKNSDITKSEIEAKLTGTITSHNHTGLMPAHHAETHHVGGSDELTPSDIGAEPALGYTPVNKAGDTMGRLEVTGSTDSSPGLTITGQRANLLFNTTGATGGVAFRVVKADITNTDNRTSTVASIGGYGGANLGGDPTSYYMYLDARPDGTWNNATLKVDSQDRVGVAISSSSRPTQTLDVNGKIRMRTQTATTDGDDIVATKKYVDDNAGGDIYHVGTSPPSDTNLFWIDTSE